jgi:hypothetical protein
MSIHEPYTMSIHEPYTMSIHEPYTIGVIQHVYPQTVVSYIVYGSCIDIVYGSCIDIVCGYTCCMTPAQIIIFKE